MNYIIHKKQSRLRGRSLFLTILLVIGVVILLLVTTVFFWYNQQLQPASKTKKMVIVDIQQGSSASEVATSLEDKGVIKNSKAFLWYLRTNNLRSGLQAGRYELNAADSAKTIANAITKGEVQESLFTIVPGERLDEIKTSLVKAGFNQIDVEAALNPDNYKNHPALAAKPASASLEGYLYPDSYQLTNTSKPSDVVEQALDEMADNLTPNIIAGFEKQGLNTHQGITLASILIKEASTPDDKQLISGVFYNRLRSNIPLGSDVTYQYIADITGQERSPFIDSPYNTRKYTGLPPGPISNVEKNSLYAAAYPKTTDYLFFVAGDDGKIYFSKTQEEHDALAKKYCKKLCSVY